jgi:hypothetical protein
VKKEAEKSMYSNDSGFFISGGASRIRRLRGVSPVKVLKRKARRSSNRSERITGVSAIANEHCG